MSQQQETTEPPIGWNDSKLTDLLEESERKFEETGHYYGLDTLELENEDPFKYRKTYYRLRGGLVNARETAHQISASPVTNISAELCFGIYTPEGDSAVVSTGPMLHVHTMSQAIKWMIREDYEDEVGIEKGDIFLNNDPHAGNVHTVDMDTLMPIFWEGELVAWVGVVTHEVDIGGISPGMALSTAVERFDDGTYWTCRKVGEDFEIHEDHRTTAKRATRTPMFNDLDAKCRLSGLLMVRDVIHDVIEDVGIDYYMQMTRESIEEGRRTFIERIKQRTVPGRYRDANFIDLPMENEAWKPQARQDYIFNQPLEMEIDASGEMGIDFDGANAAGLHSANATPAGMNGGIWVLLSQTIVYGDKVNDGAYHATHSNFPEGSWTNSCDPMLSHQCPWHNFIAAYTGLMKSISRGFFARGYREEVAAGYGQTGDVPSGTGEYNSGPLEGESWIISSIENMVQGHGASAVRDGLDYGFAVWNPESDLGDVEDYELAQGGLPYLSRRVKPNSAGHGKYRGGAAHETVAMVSNSDQAQFSSMMKQGLCFVGSGMSGGYPEATGYRLWVNDTDMEERIENQRPYPLADEDPGSGDFEASVDGDVNRKPYPTVTPVSLEEHDLVHWAMTGGEGYGDPLERDTDALCEDLQKGIYTQDVVERVYGVVADHDEEADEWVVDEEATEERREAIRREREEESVPFEEFYDEERAKLTESELVEPVERMYAQSLELSEEWGQRFLEFWDLPADFLGGAD